jgi:hypothetical protein
VLLLTTFILRLLVCRAVLHSGLTPMCIRGLRHPDHSSVIAGKLVYEFARHKTPGFTLRVAHTAMKFGKLLGRAEELLPNLKHLCLRYKELKKQLKAFRGAFCPAVIEAVQVSRSGQSQCAQYAAHLPTCSAMQARSSILTARQVLIENPYAPAVGSCWLVPCCRVTFAPVCVSRWDCL